ncbi:MAG TPA: hypothetical protein VFI93_13050 [Rhizomicrobium sp.]|jgi:hypothetical protein|nr:hypothetical protein [Rhizomicrobium sp.]
METPIHAANDIDRNETVPRIIAALAGVAVLAIVAGLVAYSGMWSPPASQIQTTVTENVP